MREITPILKSALEIDLDRQFERAGARRQDAQSRSTRIRYATARASFLAWCQAHGANGSCPAVVGTFLNSLADSGARLATIEVARSAIVDGHRTNGVSFDSEDYHLQRILAGIRRTKRKGQKSVAALEAHDVKAILALPGTDVQLVRDKALVALGFGHALRGPSELLQLDYGRLGAGNGFIQLTSGGVEIQLECSKASQEKAETLVCEVALVRACVGDWLEVGHICAGTPLFRGLRKGGAVTERRLTGQGMQNAIQRVVRRILTERMIANEAAVMAKRYGTHSLRKGLATSLARKGRSAFEIQQVTRHRSLSSVNRYVILGGQATKPVADMLDD